MKSEIIREIQEKIYPILKRYNVTKAALFGSFATGEYTQDSDVDILVEFGSEKSLLDLAGLKIDLEELLKREVDVLTYDAIYPLIRERILSEQEVIL